MKILTLKSTIFKLMAIALVSLFLLNPTSIFATNYYVSNGGSDSNNGTSQNTSFKNLAKVNSLNLKPGDVVSLKGGETFASANNSIGIKIKNSGTAQAPIVVNSYGGSRATIQSSSTFGVLVEDASHIRISNLILTGEYVASTDGVDVASNTNVGVLVKSTSKNCDNVIVDNVEASKFKWSGIRFDSENASFAVQNSIIRNCKAFLNGNRGIGTKGKNGARNKSITISNCTTYSNHGWNSIPTGSGIHVGGSNNITVQACISYNNGQYNAADAGGCGIWASSCAGVLFQFNESHGNKTRKADGCGFDIDGSVQNAVVQYNYAHDNFGAGFLIFQHNKGSAVKNITLRYNISENDGLFKKQASIEVSRVGEPLNNIENVFIYNNTIFTDKDYVGSIKVRQNDGKQLINNVNIYNNLFIRPNGNNAFQLNDSNVKRQNNYVDTQNNTVNNAGQGGILNGKLINLDAYKLKNNPTVVNAGLNLNQQFNFNTGNRDFYGNSLPQSGAFDIGAHELAGNVNPPPPPPPCAEKLANSTFSNASLSPNWQVHKGDGAEANGSINEFGVAQINISKLTNFDYNVQLWQDGLDVKANTIYKVVANIRADGNRKVRLIVRPVNLPNGGSFYMDKTVDVSSQFKTYAFQFSSPANESNVRLTFLLGANDKNVYINDVSFVEDCTKCQPEQLLQAGGFNQKNSSNIFGWKAHTGGNAIMNSSINQYGAAHLNIINGGANNYDLQLWQDDLAIEAGSTYVAKVRMRANANRMVQLIVRPVELSNGEAFFAKGDRGITTDFKEYFIEFSANKSEPNTRFSILIGGNNEDVFIDYVTFAKVCNNAKLAAGISSPKLANIYPNPANDYLKVQLYEHINDAEITVYDVHGKLLYTQTNATAGEVSVDVSKLLSGSYFIRIQSGDMVETQKILKF